MVENWKAQKILMGKLHPKNEVGEDIEPTGILAYVDNAEQLTCETLKEKYEDTFKIKDKLEDKAKTNIVGITVAITLVVGASDMLSAINNKFQLPVLQWASFSLFVVCIGYMLIAGLLVIQVLIDQNETYFIKLSSLASGDEALKEDYDKCITQNQIKNNIRNNYVFTSYACIRNSLICLFIILIFVAIPHNSMNDQPSNVATYSAQYESFLFGSSAMEYIKENDVQSDVESAIVNAISDHGKTEELGVYAILEPEKNIFIKFEVMEDCIKVLLIEPYTIP